MQTDGGRLMGDVVFVDDFLYGPEPSSTADASTWRLNGSSASCAFATDERNGVLEVTSSSTNVASIQAVGESILLAANYDVVWECRVNLTDHDGMSFSAGLGIVNTDPWTTSWTDYVGFFTTDGSINIGAGKDNNNVPGSGTSGETDTDTGVDFASDTWVVLKCIINGTTQARFWVDGVYVGKIVSNLPDDEPITPTVSTKGSAEVFNIDYFAYVATRNWAA